jgi:hypothetical protein
MHALVRIIYPTELDKGDGRIVGVILHYLGGSKTGVRRARELLDNREPVFNENQLVCDMAVRLLSRVFKDGPQADLPNGGELAEKDDEIADWTGRDPTIAAWKAYLGTIPAPTAP